VNGDLRDLDKPRVVRIESARTRTPNRRRAISLTDEEREILLAELAEIMAELDELKDRTAQITARVNAAGSAPASRPA
jgi:ubiquinone biosynthesis protein UbiJ